MRIATTLDVNRRTTDGSPTKLLVVTSDDPIYVIEFFQVFLEELPQTFTLEAIAVVRPFRESVLASFRRISRMYGLTGAVRQAGRFMAAKASGRSIAALADDKRIRVIRTGSVNDPAFVQSVRSMQVDIIASVAAPERFGPELLALPPLGCINIHSGRLPRYRGMMPTFWQMQQGEPNVTITVHHMADKLDAGDVLATSIFPLRARDTLDRVIRETKREGARLIIRTLNELRDGCSRPTPLDMREASYFSFPRQSDVRLLLRRGHRLL